MFMLLLMVLSVSGCDCAAGSCEGNCQCPTLAADPKTCDSSAVVPVEVCTGEWQASGQGSNPCSCVQKYESYPLSHPDHGTIPLKCICDGTNGN